MKSFLLGSSRVRPAFVAVVLGLAATTGGCAPIREFATKPSPDCLGALPTCEEQGPAIAAFLTSLSAANHPAESEELNLLFLSGGGSLGAWGAGFLTGWKQRPAAFRVVTGISTGALQATSAFLNEDADLRLYENISDRDIYTEPLGPLSVLSLLGGPSTRDTKPLLELIRSRITDDTLERVAKHRGTRWLCVGTTDLETGRFVAWDLTEIAHRYKNAATEKAKTHYHDAYVGIILASAAVPVLFPPVRIETGLHVDGGVRQQIFARVLGDAVTELNGNAYFLINGKLTADGSLDKETGIPIAGRSIGLLMHEAMLGNLFRSMNELSRRGSWTLRIAHIPDDYHLDLDSMKFDRPKMRALFAAGRIDGENGNWKDLQPEDLETRVQLSIR